MKILLHGKNSKNIEELIKSLEMLEGKQGFEIVTVNPDVVISYGGDGTLLTSERLYPGIPKLPLRDSLICKKCPIHSEEDLLKQLLLGGLKLVEYKKIKTTILYKDFYALNDFVIRNAFPIHTIRFKTLQNGIPGNLLLGDGIVISTAFGSTGYFKSITGESFERTSDWGIAYNNTTEKTFPFYPEDDDEVGFKLVRGKATLSFDNNPEIFNIDEGSELIFNLSDKVAKIYEPESLRCPDCVVTR